MSKRSVLYKPNPSLRMGHCAIVSADRCVFFNVPRRCGTWIGAPLSESGVSPLVFIAISGFYPESHPDHSIQDKKRAQRVGDSNSRCIGLDPLMGCSDGGK